jgi:hypothetical protein
MLNGEEGKTRKKNPGKALIRDDYFGAGVC